jgi:hypothetical protein
MKLYRLISSISVRFSWKRMLNIAVIVATAVVIIVLGMRVYGLVRAFKGL